MPVCRPGAALRAGLVNEVVPHDELMPRVMQLAGFTSAGEKSDMLMKVKELIEYRNHATLDEAYKNERAGTWIL